MFKIKKNNYTNNKNCINYKNCSGYDNRPYTNNETNIITIKDYFFKYKLLQSLNSSTTGKNEKMRIVYSSSFLDDFNPYVIKSPNVSKGLRW